MCFYSATFDVLTEHLYFTRSVQNTAVSNVTGGFVENRKTMKSMAVKHVHDMCMKCYPTLKAQCRLSPRYHCKGVKLTVHFHLVTKLWVCGAGTPQTIIRTSFLSTGLNPLEIFGFAIFLISPSIYTLLIFLPKIPNWHCKFTYHCKFCAKNGMENFWLLWTHREWLKSYIFVWISRK